MWMMGGSVKGEMGRFIFSFFHISWRSNDNVCSTFPFHVGGRVLGDHPNNYDASNPNDVYITGRGAWIPTTPFESIWVRSK